MSLRDTRDRKCHFWKFMSTVQNLKNIVLGANINKNIDLRNIHAFYQKCTSVNSNWLMGHILRNIFELFEVIICSKIHKICTKINILHLKKGRSANGIHFGCPKKVKRDMVKTPYQLNWKLIIFIKLHLFWNLLNMDLYSQKYLFFGSHFGVLEKLLPPSEIHVRNHFHYFILVKISIYF